MFLVPPCVAKAMQGKRSLFVVALPSNNSFLLPSLKMPKKSEDLKIVKQAMTFEPAV